MRVALRHNTTYHFDRSVYLFPHDVRLRPCAHCRIPILEYGLHVQPAETLVRWHSDAAGNRVARCLFSQLVSELQFDVELLADLVPFNAFDFLLDLWAMRFPFRYPDELAAELAPSLGADAASPPVNEWVEHAKRDLIGAGSVDSVTLVTDLTRRIHRDVAYTVRGEAGVQAPEQTLALAAGSCRDSSWLLIQVLRQLGLAARFVSGYLIQPESSATQQQASMDGQTQTSTQSLRADLHAWVEVYLPGGGWIGLDPTSGLIATEGHIPLAVARIPSSAAPVIGAASPSADRLTHQLHVHPA